MKTVRRMMVGVVMLWAGVSQAWTDLGGGDHGGSNWVISGGALIASNHYNLGTVTIATGSTITVKGWDGSKYGGVDISARDIRIDGTLDASGAGYSGGNGGAGGNGSTTVGASGGAGANGSAGGGAFGGAPGIRGVGGYDSAGNPALTREGWFGSAGGVGGYATGAGQGDATLDESLLMGSGGAGGGGAGAGWNFMGTTSGGGGGGAGNPGGGWIRLVATNSIVVRGLVKAKGLSGTRGVGGIGQVGMNPGIGGGGGNAGSAGTSLGGNGGASVLGQCYSGGHGGAGAAGAGGGVLLKAELVDVVGGQFDTRGGGDAVTNGGTVKIFYVDYQGGSLTNTGRAYLKQTTPPESGTIFEF